MPTPEKSKYMLIDGHALIHRGFHAVPGLTVTKTGEPIGAVYGFTMILLRAIKDLKPTHIACAFDLEGPTFRHDSYADYKVHRVKTPDELVAQFSKVKEVVRALNIPIFEKQGFEADDVLGTLAVKICKSHVTPSGSPLDKGENADTQDSGSLVPPLSKGRLGGVEVMIVTGDLDTLQLVNDCVKIYTLRKGLTDTAVYDIEAIKMRFGLEPSQMIDYKALRGDPSDNIKGVKGIGEKTASGLIQEFGSLEKLYEVIHNSPSPSYLKRGTKQSPPLKIRGGGEGLSVTPRVLQLLIDGENSARQSYDLSRIRTDVDIDVNISIYEFTSAHLSQTVELFKQLEFRSLVDKLPKGYEQVVSSKLIGSKLETTSKFYAAIPAPHSIVPTLASVIPAEAGIQDKEQGGMARIKSVEIGKQDYQLVDNEAKLERLIKELKKQSAFVLDTESTSLNIIDAELVGISICFKAGEAFYIPAKSAIENKSLKEILEGNIKKIGHNIKYDAHILKNTGVNLGGLDFDTMIASYLLNASVRQHSLDTAAFNELGYQMQPPPLLPPLKKGGLWGVGKGKDQITMDKVPTEKVSWHACEDADMIFRLKSIFETRLKEEDLGKLFRDIEMPLIPVLLDMERNGIEVDVKLLNKLSSQAEKEIFALEKDIHHLTGEEFNINSPKQLKEVLFDKLHLSTEGNRKTKTGLSTAAGELEKMLGLHPAIEKILEYREVTKLQNTYLKALPELVNAKTGRIHTSYNQTIAATGRLSSVDPNLQNIPVGESGLHGEVRKAFVAEKGYKLLSIDYSQMELRIAAHLSCDENMIETFRRGEDIHTRTAMGLFGVIQDAITKEMRRHAKTVNFGILYGLSAFGLSYRLGEIAHGDAKEYIGKYFSSFPGVKAYIEKIKLDVREHGLVKNELGRVRKFPEAKSSQFFIRQAAERGAVNFPIQSLQADIIKIAMINIHRQLAVSNLAASSECRMLLQVHDELVFEVRENKVEEYARLIKPLMQNAYKLSVPVEVEAKAGDSWGEMEKII